MAMATSSGVSTTLLLGSSLFAPPLDLHVSVPIALGRWGYDGCHGEPRQGCQPPANISPGRPEGDADTDADEDISMDKRARKVFGL